MRELVQQLTVPEALPTTTLPFVINMPGQLPLWVMAILRYLPARRLTFWACWSGRLVVAKLFLPAKRAKPHFLREFRGLAVMSQRGISTAPILYTGEGAWPGSYIIITEFLLGAKTYATCFQEPLYQQHYAQSFMNTLQQMHNCGIVQKDLHGGNFLYWRNQWYCLDGDGIIYTKKSVCIDKKTLLDNLSLACFQLISIFPHVQLDTLIKKVASCYPPMIQKKLGAKINQGLKYKILSCQQNIMNKSIRICTDFGVTITRLYQNYYQKCYWHTDDIAKIFNETTTHNDALDDSHIMHPTLGLLEKRSHSALTSRSALKRPSVKNMLFAWQYSQLLAYQDIPAIAMIAMQVRRDNKPSCSWIKVREGVSLMQYVSQYQQDAPQIRQVLAQIINIHLRMKQLRLSYQHAGAHCFAVDNNAQVFLMQLEGIKLHRSDFSLRRSIRRQWQQLLEDFQDYPTVVSVLQQHEQGVKT